MLLIEDEDDRSKYNLLGAGGKTQRKNNHRSLGQEIFNLSKLQSKEFRSAQVDTGVNQSTVLGDSTIIMKDYIDTDNIKITEDYMEDLQ